MAKKKKTDALNKSSLNPNVKEIQENVAKLPNTSQRKPNKDSKSTKQIKRQRNATSNTNSKVGNKSGFHSKNENGALEMGYPYIHIEGDPNSPRIVKVINSKSNTLTSSGTFGNVMINKVEKSELFTTIKNKKYNPSNLDDSPWVCVFCNHTTHWKGLGDLFGPYWIPLHETEKGAEEVWFHEDCVCWAPNVHMVGFELTGLDKAIWLTRTVDCMVCHQPGPSVGCNHCNAAVHVSCSDEGCWTLDIDSFVAKCSRHNSSNLQVSNSPRVPRSIGDAGIQSWLNEQVDSPLGCGSSEKNLTQTQKLTKIPSSIQKRESDDSLDYDLDGEVSEDSDSSDADKDAEDETSEEKLMKEEVAKQGQMNISISDEAFSKALLNEDVDISTEDVTPKRGAIEKPKNSSPKVKTTKADTPNFKTPKVETHKADNTPKVETHKADDTPKVETHKADDTPKEKTQKADTLKAKTPKAEDTHKADTPKTKTVIVDSPKTKSKTPDEVNNNGKESERRKLVNNMTDLLPLRKSRRSINRLNYHKMNHGIILKQEKSDKKKESEKAIVKEILEKRKEEVYACERGNVKKVKVKTETDEMEYIIEARERKGYGEKINWKSLEKATKRKSLEKVTKRKSFGEKNNRKSLEEANKMKIKETGTDKIECRGEVRDCENSPNKKAKKGKQAKKVDNREETVTDEIEYIGEVIDGKKFVNKKAKKVKQKGETETDEVEIISDNTVRDCSSYVKMASGGYRNRRSFTDWSLGRDDDEGGDNDGLGEGGNRESVGEPKKDDGDPGVIVLD